ncbi:MAG: hypothetical protein JRC93_09410 [Deltaproteobacteria bacterium]|nr:hypothetical protein [Deltaproteobacteria bacterium]
MGDSGGVFQNTLTRIIKIASGMADRGKVTQGQVKDALMKIKTTTDSEINRSEGKLYYTQRRRIYEQAGND